MPTQTGLARTLRSMASWVWAQMRRSSVGFVLSATLLILNDNDNPAALALGTYLGAGGDGADLRLQLKSDTDEQPIEIEDHFFAGGGNFTQFERSSLPAAFLAILTGYSQGDRLGVAFTRVGEAAPVAPSFSDNTGNAQTWTVGTAIAAITVPSASGTPTPTYAVVGSLPAGLSFNTNTRVISGTPTGAGSGTITIRATNDEGSDDWTVAYTTSAALSVPSFFG